jgi:hypothetical protein
MEKMGFVRVLFNLSFAEFVTTRIIQGLYVAGMVLAAIVTLVLIVMGFNDGAGTGFVALILSPVVFLLLVLWARLVSEYTIVLFRISENTSRIYEQNRKAD